MASIGTGERTKEVPSEVTLLQMTMGAWITQALSAVAKLGVADLLVNGPQTCEELASQTTADAASLYRLLRALASLGVFAEVEGGRFGLNPMAELLRSDVETSLRGWAIFMGEGFHWRAWGEFLYSVKSGKPSFDRVFGVDAFQYFAANPEAAATFNEAMRSATMQKVKAVTAAYDFSAFRRIVDVGGGNGALITAILTANPGVNGVLADLPKVVEDAKVRIAAAGLAARCECVSCDFFKTVPEGGDAYILSRVLHDWNDEQAVQILKNCRRAIRSSGKLLVIETVIPPGNVPHLGKLGDLEILVMTPGKERTEAEYRELYESAAFHLATVVPTQSAWSMIEGVPVSVES